MSGTMRTKRFLIFAAALLLVCARSTQAQDQGWRLMSVPCYSSGQNVSSLFGPAPLVTFQLNESSIYLQDNPTAGPGEAWWMYFEDEPQVQGSCMAVTQPFVDLTLKPGWNLIGNPFITSVVLPEEWTPAYEYSLLTNTYSPATVLQPWQGYFIKAPATCAGGCTLTLANPQPSAGRRADEPRLAKTVSCPVPGDTNGDSLVDVNDLFAISQYYGTLVTSSTSSSIARVDTNDDGIIDAGDLFGISQNYGDTCTAGTNLPPYAASQSVTTAVGSSVSITLSGSDPEGGSLTYSISGNPSHGTLDTGSLPAVTYTPTSGYSGMDSFLFQVSDGSLSSSPAAVYINVDPDAVPEAQTVSGITVTPDPLRRFSSLLVSWDAPTDTSINAFDIFCNGTRVNACPEQLECFTGMDCDPNIVYTYSINIPNLPNAPADPSEYECSVTMQAMSVDFDSDLIAAASKLSASVAASTFAHTADSPYAGGTTSKEGTAEDCSGLRSSARSAGRECASTSAGTISLAGARIEAWRKESSSTDPNGTLTATVYSNNEGYYEFSSLDPGFYNFIAFHDNGTSQEDDDLYSILDSVNIQPEPFQSGGFNNLGEMKLEETGSIYGKVQIALDSTGTSILPTPDTAYMGIDVYIPGTSFTAKTNQSGEFYILYIPPGTYSIVVQTDNYALMQVEDIDVESKQITTVTPDVVLLSSIGSVIGTASFDDSANNGDATVSLTNDADALDVHTVSTLTDGSFTFNNLATGTYTMEINRYGWDPYTIEDVTVQSNTTTDMGTIGPIPRIPGPEIDDVDPVYGDNDADTTITITGDNFATGTLFYIKRGIQEAQLETITYVSETEMTAVVPSGYDWGSYDIKALNPDAQTDTVNEVYHVTLPAPTLTALSVDEMDNSVALSLTLTGDDFESGAKVTIGTTITSNTSVLTSATMTTVVPAGITAGVYDVTVTNPDYASRTAVLEDAFTVNALTQIVPYPETLSIMASDTVQFSATCHYTDAATTTTTICTDDVQWFSSDINVGTITLDGGLFTALGFGVTNITAQKGTVSSNPVLATIYNSGNIFIDSGQLVGTGGYNGLSSAMSGDVTGDGAIDFITSNDYSVNYFYNDGSGTLTKNGTNYCSVAMPALGLLDYDGDGDLDMVCNGNDGTYLTKVYDNNGLGTFSHVGSYGSGSQISSIAVADFNMDGWPDWAVGVGAGPIWVDFSQGPGESFNWSTQDIGNNNTQWIEAGDINGDTYPDIVEGNFNQPNRVWLNDGTGYFTDSGQSIGNGYTSIIELGDLDGDGDLDMYEGTNAITPLPADKIWINNSGTFVDSGISLPNTQTIGATIVDFDNDGDNDIIVGVSEGAYNLFYINDGAGNFTNSQQQLNPTYTNGVNAADYTGDNKVDLAEASMGGVRLYVGGYGGIPVNTQPIAPMVMSETVSDLDGDKAYNDVTFTWGDGADAETPTNLLTYSLYIKRSDGLGITSGAIPVGPGNVGHLKSITLKNLPTGSYTWRVQTVDTGYRKSVWSNDRNFRTGMLITPHEDVLGMVDTGAVLAADLDGDGDMDIVEGRNDLSLGDQTGVVWINDGSGNFTQSSTLGSMDHTDIEAVDVDGDGDLDVVEVGWWGSSSKLWLNNGIGFFTDSGQNIDAGMLGATIDVLIADFDGDGDVDLMPIGDMDGAILYANDGSGGFSQLSNPVMVASPAGAAAGDINEDGSMDICLTPRYDGTVNCYLNDGDGTGNFTFEDSYSWGGNAVSDVELADLSGDGHLDMIVGFENYSVGGRLGDGTGAFPTNMSQIPDDTLKTEKVLIADMDVDGDPDIITINKNQPPAIYLNINGWDFESIDRSTMPVIFGSHGDIADIDGDGALDIVVAVADEHNTTKDVILLNSQVKANTAPSPPASVQPTPLSGYSVLTWAAGSDAETPANQLTYDVQIYDVDNSKWLHPAVSAYTHGFVAATRTVVMRDIPAGNYEWYVRTVDAGLKTSAWVQGDTSDPAPPVFTGITSATGVVGGAQLEWDAASDPSQPITYNIYYSTVSGGQNFSSPDATVTDATGVYLCLPENQTYYFVVRAQDSWSTPNEDTNTVELSALTDATVVGDVLLVDGDWSLPDYNAYYTTSLTNNGITYDHYDRLVEGAVTAADLDPYMCDSRAVFWYAGDQAMSTRVMSSAEDDIVIDFLDGGGRLFITGEDVGYVINSYSNLYQNYLGCSGDYEGGLPYILDGVGGDPISAGLTLDIQDVGGDGANNQNYRSRTNLNGSTPAGCFIYQGTSYTACVRNEGNNWRTVYFAFGFEGIDDSADRDAVMLNVFNYLTGP